MSVLCSGSYLADFIVPDLPEIGAPGSLVYAPKGIHFSPGGHSANVALGLVQLGRDGVHSTGCVGDDPLGKLTVALLGDPACRRIPRWPRAPSRPRT